MSFLLKNSRDFLHVAKRDFDEGLWNLVLFHSEQALQLCLKYKLYTHVGDYPKTHNLIELVDELNKFERIELDRAMLDLLSQAYITSRYLPFSFSKETAQKALNFVEEVMKEVGCLS